MGLEDEKVEDVDLDTSTGVLEVADETVLVAGVVVIGEVAIVVTFNLE
jgi:hypothetical protein